MKSISILFSFLSRIAACLLILVLIEGVATLGHAFDFSTYSWIGWLIQTCFIIIAIYAAIYWFEEDERAKLKNSKYL